MSVFDWNPKTSEAALLLAQGFTKKEVAEKLNIADRTIYRWQSDMEFSAEVDRLSLMVGVAGRADRLRIAQRFVRQQTESGFVNSEKDLLEWLKFAQSETDGAKLDLAALEAAFGNTATPVAARRPGSSDDYVN